MRVTLDDVKRSASLSMLKLDDEQMSRMQQDLDEILAQADRLNELDTEGAEPTIYILTQQNVLREDEQVEDWDRAELLKNAPQQEDGCFVVPQVVD